MVIGTKCFFLISGLHGGIDEFAVEGDLHPPVGGEADRDQLIAVTFEFVVQHGDVTEIATPEKGFQVERENFAVSGE